MKALRNASPDVVHYEQWKHPVARSAATVAVSALARRQSLFPHSPYKIGRNDVNFRPPSTSGQTVAANIWGHTRWGLPACGCPLWAHDAMRTARLQAYSSSAAVACSDCARSCGQNQRKWLMWTRSQDRRLRVARQTFKTFPWTTAACIRLSCAIKSRSRAVEGVLATCEGARDGAKGMPVHGCS